MKTREVERLKYKTTIVGYDKIEKGLENIQEGLKVIKKYELSNIGCRFRENKKIHIEIPVEILEFVSSMTPLQGDCTERVNKLFKK